MSNQPNHAGGLQAGVTLANSQPARQPTRKKSAHAMPPGGDDPASNAPLS
jgi:hypothetical protein